MYNPTLQIQQDHCKPCTREPKSKMTMRPRGTMTASKSDTLDHDPRDPTERDGPGQGEMNPQLSLLTRRQVLAMPILAAAPNRSQAAREAGISERTLRRWLQDEPFQTELDRLTSEIAETIRQELKALTLHSFRVMNELLEHPDPMVRLRTARTIAFIGLRVIDLETLPKEATSGHPDQAANHPSSQTA